MDFPDSTSYTIGIFKEHKNFYSICLSQMFDVYSHSEFTLSVIRNIIFFDKYYYKFVSQKEYIQQAMEKRALDKILKRIINDDFTW